MNTMLDIRLYNNVYKAKDASTHTAELEMLKSGKKNDDSVLIIVFQVFLTR